MRLSTRRPAGPAAGRAAGRDAQRDVVEPAERWVIGSPRGRQLELLLGARAPDAVDQRPPGSPRDSRRSGTRGAPPTARAGCAGRAPASSVTSAASVSLNIEWSLRLAEPTISDPVVDHPDLGVHVDQVGDRPGRRVQRAGQHPAGAAVGGDQLGQRAARVVAAAVRPCRAAPAAAGTGRSAGRRSLSASSATISGDHRYWDSSEISSLGRADRPNVGLEDAERPVRERRVAVLGHGAHELRGRRRRAPVRRRRRDGQPLAGHAVPAHGEVPATSATSGPSTSDRDVVPAHGRPRRVAL